MKHLEACDEEHAEHSYDPLRSAEHLKAFVTSVFNAFHTGSGDNETPMTIDMAQAAIWREVEVCINDEYPGAFDRVAYYRVTVPAGKAIPEIEGAPVVASRCLGRRNPEDPDVYYLTLQTDDFAAGYKCKCVFEQAGLEVRDWRFGCIRQ
jgi:hypothetical protein